MLQKGFKVIAQNWRTRWCEIDLVAVQGDVVYFVEVKYRRSSEWGDGLDYITQRKLRQMRFAADFWLAAQSSRAIKQSRLSAMSLSGQPPRVDDWLVDVQ